MKSKGLGVTDQKAENAVTRRKRADPAVEVLINANGNEMAQGPVTPNDSQGTVLSFNKMAGRTNHPVQHRLQAEVLSKGYDGTQKALHPLPDARGFPDTVIKISREFVKSRAANGRGAVRWLPDGFAHRNHLPEILQITVNRLQQLTRAYLPPIGFITA
jgi:hypothetical protein